MMQSPYFTGATANFGPPSGLAGLIAQGRDATADLRGFQQFADVAEKFKQQQDAGKAADYFVKANPDSLGQLGIHPEQWKTLGSREKADAVGGLMKAQGAQETMQRFADYAAQARERNAQADASEDAGKLVQAFGQDLPAGTPDTPQNRLQQALKAAPPRDVGRSLPQAIDALNKFYGVAQAQNPQLQFQTDPQSGRRFATFGRELMSSDPLTPTVQNLDVGGSSVPVIVGSKGTVQQVKPSGAELNPRDALATYNKNQARLAELATSMEMAQDPKYAGVLDKDAIQAEMTDLKAQNEQLKAVWQKGAGAPPKTPSQPMPLPTNKKDLQAGQVYQTSRGPATWDGDKFTQ